MSLVIREKDDQFGSLLNLDKERDDLLHGEASGVLPAEANSSEEINGLFSAFERDGSHIGEDAFVRGVAPGVLAIAEEAEIDVRDSSAHAEDARSEKANLDETPGVLDKTNDPVRLYLREMGSVPLLKREGEVAIANAWSAATGWCSRRFLALRLCSKSSSELAGSCATGRVRSRRSCISTKKS